MIRLLRTNKGFTLIELMIVVAIIGILAAIAIPNFLTFRLKVKTSEAKSNLGAIRTVEEAYRHEEDSYYPPGSTIALYPGNRGTQKQTWTASETEFSALGFEPAGMVYYDYTVSQCTQTTFTAGAYGDLDGDGVDALFEVDQDGSDICQRTAINVY